MLATISRSRRLKSGTRTSGMSILEPGSRDLGVLLVDTEGEVGKAVLELVSHVKPRRSRVMQTTRMCRFAWMGWLRILCFPLSIFPFPLPSIPSWFWDNSSSGLREETLWTMQRLVGSKFRLTVARARNGKKGERPVRGCDG